MLLDGFKETLAYITLPLIAEKVANSQCNALATRAIQSVVTTLREEAPEVEGFKVKNRYYELIYQNSQGDFELTVSLGLSGEVRFFLVTDKFYKRTSKKVLREVSAHDAALALADFYKVR